MAPKAKLRREKGATGTRRSRTMPLPGGHGPRHGGELPAPACQEPGMARQDAAHGVGRAGGGGAGGHGDQGPDRRPVEPPGREGQERQGDPQQRGRDVEQAQERRTGPARPPGARDQRVEELLRPKELEAHEHREQRAPAQPEPGPAARGRRVRRQGRAGGRAEPAHSLGPRSWRNGASGATATALWMGIRMAARSNARLPVRPSPACGHGRNPRRSLAMGRTEREDAAPRC